jgi:hypothetical protein
MEMNMKKSKVMCLQATIPSTDYDTPKTAGDILVA